VHCHKLSQSSRECLEVTDGGHGVQLDRAGAAHAMAPSIMVTDTLWHYISTKIFQKNLAAEKMVSVVGEVYKINLELSAMYHKVERNTSLNLSKLMKVCMLISSSGCKPVTNNT
jgi:hypothetical protein